MKLAFEPIGLENQTEYMALLAKCPQSASDYSFANIWGWGEEYGLHWAWHEGLAWIRQTRSPQTYWAPVGNWTETDWKAIFEDIDL